jgi:hypothetical protein
MAAEAISREERLPRCARNDGHLATVGGEIAALRSQ